MSDKSNDAKKIIPPGWNDPPPISTIVARAKPKMNQRVAFPSTNAKEPTQTSALSNIPASAGPPLITPLTCIAPPPLGLRATIIPSAPPEEDPSADIKDIIKFIEELNEEYGKEKSPEIKNRLAIMVEKWPSMNRSTQCYAYEAVKSLYDKDIDNAKKYHEKLVQEYGLDVVHWVLMLKILINQVPKP